MNRPSIMAAPAPSAVGDLLVHGTVGPQCPTLFEEAAHQFGGNMGGIGGRSAIAAHQKRLSGGKGFHD